MTQDATVDQLQRYLQEQLVEAEDISNVEQRKQRILKLETALFEAIEFIKSVEDREIIESVIFEESTSVRLISSSNNDDDDDGNTMANSESCPKCDEPQSSEFSFCQVCGYQRK